MHLDFRVFFCFSRNILARKLKRGEQPLTRIEIKNRFKGRKWKTHKIKKQNKEVCNGFVFCNPSIEIPVTKLKRKSPFLKRKSRKKQTEQIKERRNRKP